MNIRFHRGAWLLAALVCTQQLALADVRLPQFYGNGMVLQREKPVAFWGWSDPDEGVSVTLLGKEYLAKPDASGRWQVSFDAQPAGGPHVISIRGKNQVTVSDVLFGDVWVCGGQSNMEWHIQQLNGKYDEMLRNTPANPQLRYIEFKKETALAPKADAPVVNGWVSARVETLPSFSAVGYFFAKNLYDRYQVPIGLVACNWGGTVAEAWMDYASLSQFPALQQQFDQKKGAQPASPPASSAKTVTWEEAVAKADLGSGQAGSPAWYDSALKTADWKTLKQPGAWEDGGMPGFDGIAWLRREVMIPKNKAGKPLTLNGFQVDDADVTYFNGEKIGSTDGYNLPRRYVIPGRLVKAGRNVLALRVLDTGGGGGIVGEADSLSLQSGPNRIALAGDWQYKIATALKDFPPNPHASGNNPNVPTVLYNGMLNALVPYGIRGVIWYQGESNAGRAYEYRTLFPTMIRNWRQRFGQGDVPFLFVQLANFMKPAEQPGESNWAELREAQRMALAEPATGMATIIDIGEEKDIHPKNKFDVGRRLALAAMNVTYGDREVTYSGPIYHSMLVEGDKIRLAFDHVAGGLTAKGSTDGTLKGFAIAGADKKWVWATAKIDRNTVLVSSDAVKNPVAVRYAWADNPVGCNLYNAADLPASPFRTDEWKGITQK